MPGPAVTAIIYHGQTYRLTGRVFDHTTSKGRALTLLEWESLCPDCGAAYNVTTTAVVSCTNLRRRCDACRQRQPYKKIGYLRAVRAAPDDGA